MKLSRLIWITFLLLESLLLVLPLPVYLTWTLGIMLLLLFLACLAWGAASIHSGMFIRAICKGDPGNARVALTFDDGPHPEATPKILDFLESEGIKATFFLRGDAISGQEALVRKLHRSGHTLGNHSYHHRSFFPLMSPGRIADEIRSTSSLLEEITGERVRYFRPPFGVSNPRIARGLRNSGLEVIGWSIRSFDTRNEDPARVIRRIGAKLEAGSVILLHDQSAHILEILELLIPLIRERGLTCVNMDKLLNVKDK